MAEGFKFAEIISNLNRVKREVPIKIANVTTNYFAQSFKKQAFGSQVWAEVERRKPDTKAYKYATKSERKSNILARTGTLRKAVQGSLKTANWDKIEFVVDVSAKTKSGYNYAAIHNEGGHAGRGKGFEMPKRQFIGDTQELRELQLKAYYNAIDKIWK
jgi:phage gpG-like protein